MAVQKTKVIVRVRMESDNGECMKMTQSHRPLGKRVGTLGATHWRMDPARERESRPLHNEYPASAVVSRLK